MTLRVTLEIIPFGVEADARKIEVINISNQGQVDLGVCQYVVEHNSYKRYDDNTPRITHEKDHGAIRLVIKALQKLDGDE